MKTSLTEYAKHFAYGVLIISTFLMGYVVYDISLAKQRFARQLISNSVAQTKSDLDSFFVRINLLLDAAKDQYSTGVWANMPRETTILHHISLIKNYDPISSIGIADRRGYELNIIPDSAENQWLTRSVFVDRWGYTEKWSRWHLGNTLTLMESWNRTLEVDPRERPWFKGALRKQGGTFWTTPYEYTTGPEVGITASALIPNPGNIDSLSKIVAFDLTLDDLSVFIEDLTLTSNQHLFLLASDNSKVLALNGFDPASSPARLDSVLFQSPEKLNNQGLLEVLNRKDNRNAFDFTIDGETWWGVLKPYQITENRAINIVSILPEDDFASEIRRTLWISIGSFFLILFLSLMVVRNHNKLHRFGRVLSQKNRLIGEQKKFLFSEVHHRVKNNLALLSSFLELELFKVKHPLSRTYLNRFLHRVKVIAITQEEGYQSDQLGTVSIKKLCSRLMGYIQQSGTALTVRSQYPQAYININQALSYGLLINELMGGLYKWNKDPLTAEVEVAKEEGFLFTEISFPAEEALIKHLSNIKEKEIISALCQQLDADFNIQMKEVITISFSFELVNKKGIVGNSYYKA